MAARQSAAQRDRLGDREDRRMRIGLVRRYRARRGGRTALPGSSGGDAMRRSLRRRSRPAQVRGAAPGGKCLQTPSPAMIWICPGCGCSSGVEHDLAKVGVEGSNPFARSITTKKPLSGYALRRAGPRRSTEIAKR